MKELHALVDFENVQPSSEELAKLAPGFTDVWIFHNPQQVKRAQQLAAGHPHVTLVPHSGKGKNALDFHLSFYLGYVAAKHPTSHLVVVANDKGYDSMIRHANALGFTARRVGSKAKKTIAAKTVAKKVATTTEPTPAKNAAAVIKPAPGKKVPAKRAVAKKSTAKRAVSKKAPAAPVASGAPAKKQPSKVKGSAQKAARPKPLVSVDPKTLDRVKQGLAKMGNKRPHKLKSFLHHVESMQGKDRTQAATQALVQKLEQEKVVQIAGDMVL